jgi:hypothetical protein
MSDGVSTRTLSLAELPEKSHFYEQVTAVKRFLIFVFPSLVLLPLLSLVKVDPRCCLSTVFLFALLGEPFVAL